MEEKERKKTQAQTTTVSRAWKSEQSNPNIKFSDKKINQETTLLHG